MKFNTYTIILIVFFCFSFIEGNSQTILRSTISAAGGFSASNNNTLFSNLGEILISTFSTQTNHLTEGFIQPYTLIVTEVELQNIEKSISVFPNPARGIITVRSMDEKDISILVTDIQGRVMLSEVTESLNGSADHQINLESLNSGIYFVYVKSLRSDKTLKTIRLIKL